MSDFSVASAASGAQALEVIAAKGTPAVVVTDLTLGDMDGVDLARTIRSTPATANVPIVAATGHSGFEDPERIFASILIKPIALPTLVETLKKTMMG